MPLAANDRHPVKNATVCLGLTWKTSKSISVALDLEAFKLSVDNRDINPRIAHENP
jgi:hypothetical protein